tara:strand:- start:7080 stop:7457 length:378 start_codon:yes stop_codon:yes gene_type:complete
MGTAKKEEKKGFIERVLSFINGGEEAKIERFKKHLTKELDNSKKVTKDEIDTLKDSLDDDSDARVEALINIDPKSVATIEDVKAYIPKYIEKQNVILKKTKATKEEIKALETKIELYDSVLNDIK